MFLFPFYLKKKIENIFILIEEEKEEREIKKHV
jgi:hypothetical protein